MIWHHALRHHKHMAAAEADFLAFGDEIVGSSPGVPIDARPDGDDNLNQILLRVQRTLAADHLSPSKALSPATKHRIWEDIMHTTSSASADNGKRARSVDGHLARVPKPRATTDSLPFTSAGWLPILNGVLAAALILAIAAGLWRASGGPDIGSDSGENSGNPGQMAAVQPRGVTPEATGDGPAPNDSVAAATLPATPSSPTGSPPAADSCPVAPLTDEEIATIRDEGSGLPAREYTSVTTTTPERVSRLNEAIRVSNACSEATSTNANVAFALVTDRWLLENPLGPSDRQTVVRSRQISEEYGEALIGAEPTQPELDAMLDRYHATDIGITNDLGIMGMIEGNPQVFRDLSDGRVVAYPAELWLRRSGMLPPLETAPEREAFLATTWAFQRDRWLLDEQLIICLGDCEPFWAQANAELDRGAPAPAGTPPPGGAPSATPASASAANPSPHGRSRYLG